MLRPRATRWFEVLAARDDATLVLEALARTGAVELEARSGAALPAALAEVVPLLARCTEWRTRYAAYGPDPARCRPSAFPEAPVPALHRCLATLQAWSRDAEPVVQALQRAQAEAEELRLWQPLLPALAERWQDPAALAAAGPWLALRLVLLPSGVDPALALPGSDGPCLVSRLQVSEGSALLVAGPPPALDATARAVTALHGRVVPVPAWLQQGADPVAVGTRLAGCLERQQALHAELQRLNDRHALAVALGDANRLQWVLQNVRALDSGEWLCWVTGWSSDADGTSLHAALQASGARALLHFPPPPPGSAAPLLLANPRWARPFEVFSRALGMPAADEADPSALLAIAVPLMFGYMFGDVGQGLVIAALAWWFRDRVPVARLLMVGGLSAALFGLLFGSVFSLHGVVPALWLHPLDDPLAVLMAPLAGGAVLLTLGLALDALAAWWRRALGHWLLTEGAAAVVYLALLAALLEPAALPVAGVAALVCCAGHALHARRLGAALSGLGELVEKTLQILINTLSFARVGAFALAHAGLSSAIVALMAAADSSLGKALVFVAGNALVIVLEAMVVSIQTTRLVLFEFFTRFMQARGRAFRPLPPPPFTAQET